MLAGGVIVLISMGLRQSFGIFMQPLGCVLGIDRESFGLAIALQNLLLGLPLAGYLADRFSPRRVVVWGALLYVAAMFLMTRVEDTPGLLLVLGLLTGTAQSAEETRSPQGFEVTGYVGALLPLAWLIWRASQGLFLVDPVREIITGLPQPNRAITKKRRPRTITRSILRLIR